MHNNPYNNRDYYFGYIYGETDPETLRENWHGVAKQICSHLTFRTMLDVGCSIGLLVSAMRQERIAAYGIDVSEYAIGQVLESDRPYVHAQDVFEPLPKSFPDHFDLVTCIEVAEHIHGEQAEAFVKRLCQWGTLILFSSHPSALNEPTHCNVQQQEYWCRLFAKNGYFRCLEEDYGFLTPQTMCFAAGEEDVTRIVEEYERSIRIRRDTTPTISSELYFDLGNGFVDENCLRTKHTVGTEFRIRINNSGIRRVRFVPSVWSCCLVKDVRLVTAQRVFEPCGTNGLVCEKMIAFPTETPYLDFELTGQETPFAELYATLYPLDNTDLQQFLMNVMQEMRDVAAKQREDIRTMQAEAESAEQKYAALRQKLEAETCDANKRIELLEAELDAEHRMQAQQTAEQTEYTEALSKALSAARSEIAVYAELVAAERGDHQTRTKQLQEQVEQYHRMYQEISNARWWKLTAPCRAVSNLIKRCLKNKPKPSPYCSQDRMPARHAAPDNAYVFRDTDTPVQEIPTVVLDGQCKRINLVTDTIESSSLLGGVATALIVATTFCIRYGYALRIITRLAPPVPQNYRKILDMSGIQMPEDVSFYSDVGFDPDDASAFRLEVTADDIFFATSWWSAEAISKTTIRRRFFYIIQEVESFFYCHGGESAMCDRVMRNPNIDFIVNSHYLRDYFANAEPVIAAHSEYFEPAFPQTMYRALLPAKKDKYCLFFYSRPNNPRNMFRFGVNVIDEAIRRGVLNTEKWDICFIGQQVPDVMFCNGSKPHALGQMSWEQYCSFLQNVDLALCLMYTPHPSYPPFDVACSGGVVVTNTCMNKQSFPQSRNVLMGEPDCDSMVEALRRGVELAMDTDTRWKNYQESTIPIDWTDTLASTMTYMERCVQ